MKSDLSLYFLSDEYYARFQDSRLFACEKNPGAEHNRAVFYAFEDIRNPDIFWLVPISANVEKYKDIVKANTEKGRACDAIRFGCVLGREAAFLIQDMCPATKGYMIPYSNRNGERLTMGEGYARDIQKNAKKLLELKKCGSDFIYPDVFSIYESLEKDIAEDRAACEHIAKKAGNFSALRSRR